MGRVHRKVRRLPIAKGDAEVSTAELVAYCYLRASLSLYFSERNEIGPFTTHVVEAIRDDRLQSDKRSAMLFASLAEIQGFCPAAARLVSTVFGSIRGECSPELQKKLLEKIRSAGAVGREDEARRTAIVQLKKTRRSGSYGRKWRSQIRSKGSARVLFAIHHTEGAVTRLNRAQVCDHMEWP